MLSLLPSTPAQQQQQQKQLHQQTLSHQQPTQQNQAQLPQSQFTFNAQQQLLDDANLSQLLASRQDRSLLPNPSNTATVLPGDFHLQFPNGFQLSTPALEDLQSHSDNQDFGSMQSDNWSASLAQYTPKLGRFSHQRESSLSSVGSAGPASPFNQNFANPQIAVTDSTDMASDLQAHDGTANAGNSYYQLAKSMNQYPGYQNLDQAVPDLAYPITVPGPSSKPRLERGLLPAPDLTGGALRSHPTSVTSSNAGDSPATPTVTEAETIEKRRRGERRPPCNASMSSNLTVLPVLAGVPKLDRTMTDIYSDELYNPNFAITSTPPTQESLITSPTNEIFNQRINAANNQHLSAAHSPASSTSRGRSPFRNGSPLAPSPSNDFAQQASAFNSAQKIREQNKAEQDARLLQQQMAREREPETPKTISPKDAILEFHEPEAGEATFPLFPQDSGNFDMDQFTKAMLPQNQGMQNGLMQQAGGQFNYLASQIPQNLQVPQQYPFVARNTTSHTTPPRLSSACSSSTGSGSSTPVNISRPSGTAADGGTYTCTYHGCTLRFETPALLQKHKREGHRQTQIVGISRPAEMGMTSSLLNSQAGPHRCDRINPGTNKPCNTVFSRPYDLTRHEDTIHNGRKQKVRCDLCTEEKTFSRADALTRHYRVCHPDMELPGKHRRRAGV
jgi:hypothetical protein